MFTGAQIARAAANFKDFTPLLVDLSGWQADAPQGMTMDASGGSITTASRHYSNGDNTLDASVMTGAAATGPLVEISSGMKMETADSHMLPDTIAGLKAFKVYDLKNKSGTLMIALSDQAVFVFNYTNISEDEALQLATKFDLSAISKASEAK
jgi:hypothetical protein